MTDARERLSRLIELATEPGPEKQRALAFELCDLLTSWPDRYPQQMREPFEALMEKVLKRLDGTTRRMIAARLAAHAETPLSLLNGLYFDLALRDRARILACNEATQTEEGQPLAASGEQLLIAAARQGDTAALVAAFVSALQIPKSVALRIVEDTTGNALAVACKAAGMARATYSALALLTVPQLRHEPAQRMPHLKDFESISPVAARALLAYWRRVEHPAAKPDSAAA